MYWFLYKYFTVFQIDDFSDCLTFDPQIIFILIFGLILLGKLHSYSCAMMADLIFRVTETLHCFHHT